MKFLFIILTTLIAINVNSQSFNGVSISGDLQTAVKSFESKGFKLITKNNGSAVMRGILANRNMELYILVTPKSKQIFRVVGYFDKIANWYDLEKEYENYVSIIKDKYGMYTSTYSFFSSPYESGDGNELQAISTEKANFKTFWFLPESNVNISVEISKFQRVAISYENPENVKIRNKEQAEIVADSF